MTPKFILLPKFCLRRAQLALTQKGIYFVCLPVMESNGGKYKRPIDLLDLLWNQIE